MKGKLVFRWNYWGDTLIIRDSRGIELFVSVFILLAFKIYIVLSFVLILSHVFCLLNNVKSALASVDEEIIFLIMEDFSRN